MRLVVLLLAVLVLASPSFAADVAQLFIYPGNVQLVIGSTQRFRVFGLDAAGNEVPVQGVTWSAKSTLGTIDQSGLFRAGASTGRSTLGVQATLPGGLSGGAIVEVLPLVEQAGMVLDHVWKQPIPGHFGWEPKIVVDSASRLYVTDDHCLQRFEPSGSYAGTVESPAGQPSLGNLTSITHFGGAFYANWGDRVCRLSTTGSILQEYVLPQWYGFRYGIAVDSAGNVYIGENGITKVRASGEFATHWTTSYAPDYVACINSSVYAVGNVIPLSCDCPDSRIQRFDVEGNLRHEWGTTGRGDGQFWVAGGVAPDQFGRPCIVDKGNRRVQVFRPDGTYLSQWSVDDGSQYTSPQDIKSDNQGGFYITYTGSNAPVRRYDSSGRFVKQLGIAVGAEKQPREPEELDSGPGGGLVVADSRAQRVFTYDSMGTPLASWNCASVRSSPISMATSRGDVYIWDGSRDVVCRFDSSGTLTVEMPVLLKDPPYHVGVSDMAAGSDGSLYLLSVTGKRVYRYSPQGGIVQQLDIPGLTPDRIAVDEHGSLYVSGGDRVTVFSTSGELVFQWPAQGARAIAAHNGVVLVGRSKSLSRYDTRGELIGSWSPADPGRYGFVVSSVCINEHGGAQVLDGLNNRLYTLTIPLAHVPKDKPDGGFACLAEMVVTAGSEEFGDCFYAQSSDATSGIKVTGGTARRGDKVAICGTLSTVRGERELAAVSVRSTGSASAKPWGMNLIDVGGGAWGLQDAPWAWRWIYKPAEKRSEHKWVALWGVSNIGLLVRTWGMVESVDPAGSAFVISVRQGESLKCRAPSGVQLPSTGQLVCLTGIGATEQDTSGQLLPLLRLRSAADIQIVGP